MKIIKSIKKFFVFNVSVASVLIFSFAIGACQEDKLKEIATSLEIDVTEFKLTIDDSSAKTVKIKCNGPWKPKLIPENTDWIQLDDATVKGNGSFSFTPKSNVDGIPRICKIVVNAGHVKDYITIEQAGEDVKLELSENAYDDEKGLGGTVSVDIDTNIPNSMLKFNVEYKGDDKGWINELDIVDGKFQFVLNRNEEDQDAREASITLEYTDPYDKVYSDMFTVKQGKLDLSIKGHWFVKTNGKGSGISWDEAMSGDQFINNINNKIFNKGDVIHVAAGVYYVGNKPESLILFGSEITIMGGYPSDITGQEMDITYPSVHETIISGDVNKNNIADNGDCGFANVVTKEKIIIKGVVFENGYKVGQSFSTSGDSDLELHYCTFRGIVSPSGNCGALFLWKGTQVYCYKTIFENIKATARGAAIRCLGGKLILESCLIHDNTITDKYGGAIQIGAGSGVNSEFYCINTTIVGNKALSHGPGLAISDNQKAYIISSTIANNSITGSGAVEGYGLRIEGNDVYIINSVITDPSADAGKSIFVKAGKTINSYGYNVIGSYEGTLNVKSSDVTGKFSSDVFGGNVLSENGGYPKTMAIENKYTNAPLSEIQTLLNGLGLREGIDITVDQRGIARSAEEACSGAYEKQ